MKSLYVDFSPLSEPVFVTVVRRYRGFVLQVAVSFRLRGQTVIWMKKEQVINT